MPNPTKRHTRMRRNNRRSHIRVRAPSSSTCAQCGEAKLPHRICPHCGTYRGREYISVEEL